jgi:hypothetical protein
LEKFSKIQLEVVKENPKYAMKIDCLLLGSKQQFGDEGPWKSEALTYQPRPPTYKATKGTHGPLIKVHT